MKKLPNLPREEFESLLKSVPLSTVECVIKSEEGVLLTKREMKPFRGYWHIPGGFVGYGETFEEAVKRVVKRETGLNAKAETFLGYYDKPHLDPRGHVLGHVFLAKIVSGNLNGAEPDKIRFFKKIPEKTIRFHKEILKRLIN